MSESRPAEAEPAAIRAIDDVESLRALAEPIRLAILNALMQPRRGELPVMSAKELAAQLGEPQTKLYRHIRQLEAAGLIRVGATRMVSGILEQRYQACQRDFSLGSGFLREHPDESERAMRALMIDFSDGFFAAFRNAELAPDAVPADQAFRRPKMFAADATVGPAKAAELRSRVEEFTDWLSENVKDEHDGIRVNLLVGYYSESGPEEG